MKSACITAIFGMMLLPCAGFAQTATAPSATAPTAAVAPADQKAKPAVPAPTEAQKPFALLKPRAGIWQGAVKTDPPQPGFDQKPMQVSMRVTSSGNVFVHDMKQVGAPDDGSQLGDITLFYLDEDRLMAIHYCDAGNRPRMVGKVSADGKTVEFNFLDVSGGTQYGLINHAVFTFIDANHHTEDWTYMQPGNKAVHAHFDLRRTK